MARGAGSGGGVLLFEGSQSQRQRQSFRPMQLLHVLGIWCRRRYHGAGVVARDKDPGVATALRPYQEECISTCLEEFSRGITRQAVSLPVGSGKTVVFANLISRLPEIGPGGKKVLILAHRDELLTQAQRQIQRFAPRLRVSIERGRYNCDHESDDVIIASVATLGRGLTNDRLSKFDPRRFKAIIIDEAHHAVAESYMRIMKHFGVEPIDRVEPSQVEGDIDNSSSSSSSSREAVSSATTRAATNSSLLVWGCSATFSRNDELALGSLFQKIVYHLDISRLIREGWLCRAEFREIYTEVDLEKVSVRRGDFDLSQLNLAINTLTRNELVAATWHKVAFEEQKRRATIVFALDVDHACNLSRAFLELGIATEIITGETPEVDRRRILENFAQGRVPVLLNCAVLTEGTDLPITDCVVLTRPTCNSNLYTQMVGRGLRRHEGKEYCLVLDFIDRLRSRNRSLANFPSLFAARRETTSQAREGEEGVSKPRVRRGFADIDAGAVAVRIQSRGDSNASRPSSPGYGLAWIQVDTHLFALQHRTSSFMLDLDRNSPEMATLYSLEELRTPSKYGRIAFTRTSIRSEPLPVYTVVPELVQILSSSQVLDVYRADAYWRRHRPPSPQQRAYLGHIFTTIPGVDPSLIEGFYGWSMGRVSDLIAKYRLRRFYLRKPFLDFEDFLSGVSHY